MSVSRLVLDLATRQRLWAAGWGGLDSSLRFAAVELELWLMGRRIDRGTGSDGEQRHFTNFLAWAETTFSGADAAIKQPGDQALILQWDALRDAEFRQTFRRLRNIALKERTDVAPLTPLYHAEGGVMLANVLLSDESWTPVYGTADDYLVWIREEILPIVDRAIELGSRGPSPAIDEDFPLSDQMPFGDLEVWTTRSDPEIALLLDS